MSIASLIAKATKTKAFDEEEKKREQNSTRISGIERREELILPQETEYQKTDNGKLQQFAENVSTVKARADSTAGSFSGLSGKITAKAPSFTAADELEQTLTSLKISSESAQLKRNDLNKRKAATDKLAGQLDAQSANLEILARDPRIYSDETARDNYIKEYQKYQDLTDVYRTAVDQYNSELTLYNATANGYEKNLNRYKELAGQGSEFATEYNNQADQLNREADDLINESTQLLQRLSYNAIDPTKREETQARAEELQAQAQQKRDEAEELYRKSQTMLGSYYSVLPDASDFTTYSKVGPSKASHAEDALYDYINDIKDESGKGFRERVNEGPLSNEYATGDWEAYTQMSDEEIAAYNYLYAKEGKEKADQYLKYIRESLNARLGAETYENLSGVGKALYWVPQGLDQFGQGFKQLFHEEALPISATQFTGQAINKELRDIGGVWGTLAAGAYGLGTTVANMAPSILVSYVTGGMLSAAAGNTISAATAAQIASATGSAVMGASAGGNAYNMKLKEGWTKEQAKAYGTLVGASEALLQYLIGGIDRLGGGVIEKAAKEAGKQTLSDAALENILVQVSKIDSAFGKAALEFGARLTARGMSEAIEEGLQEILEPLFANIIHGDKIHVDLGNVAYAALMGFLTAGIFDASNVLTEMNARANGGFDVNTDGYLGRESTDWFDGCKTMSELRARITELQGEYHWDRNENLEIGQEIVNQYTMRSAFLRAAELGSNAGTNETEPASQSAEQTELYLPTAETEQTNTAQNEQVTPTEQVTSTEEAPAEEVQSEITEPSGPIDLELPVIETNGTETPAPEVEKATSRELIEKLRNSIPDLKSMDSLANLKGDEFQKTGGKLTEQVGAFFERLGNKVFRRGLGDVTIDRRGVKSDIAHGIGRAKAVTFAAVPDVIANGKQIDYQPNWKGRGADSYVYAGPVNIGGRNTFVAAVVLSDTAKRFYLHEVVDSEGNLIYKIDAPATIKTGVTAESGITGVAEAPTGENNGVLTKTIIPQQEQTVNAEPQRIDQQTAVQNTTPQNEQNGGITNGEQRSEQTQPADNGTDQGEISLPGGDTGRGRPVAGRERTERIPAQSRIRGGSTEHAEVIAQRRDAVKNQPYTSPAAQGVPFGTDTESVQRLSESDYDAEARSAVDWAMSKGIRDVVLLVGDVGIATEAGATTTHAVIDRQTGILYARADSNSRSLSENIEHEVGHWLTERENVQAFMDTVKQYKEAAWKPIFNAYKHTYEKYTNNYEGMTDAEIELYVWEEIMEDAYSETNRFGVRAGVYGPEADAALNGTEEALADYPETSAAETATLEEAPNSRGPPKTQNVKFSAEDGDLENTSVDDNEVLEAKLPGANALDIALEMLDNGASSNEVYTETGLVVTADGSILDGIDGEVVGRYDYGSRSNNGNGGSPSSILEPRVQENAAIRGRTQTIGTDTVQGFERYADRTEYQRERIADILYPALDNEYGREYEEVIGVDGFIGLVYDTVSKGRVDMFYDHFPGLKAATQRLTEFMSTQNTVVPPPPINRGEAIMTETVDSEGEELSQQQLDYFARTATVDDNGALLALYTGSRLPSHSIFDMYRGTWVTPDREHALTYAESQTADEDTSLYAGSEDRLYRVYANIVNPVDVGEINVDATHENIEALLNRINASDALASEIRNLASDNSYRYIFDMTKTHEFQSLLRNADYDGIFATADGIRIMCAIKDSNQIKLTSNKTPTGHPDVRFSAGDETEQDNKPAKKPSKESKPTIAKKDLRTDMLNLFSIPSGMRTEMGTIVDTFAEKMLAAGRLTQEDYDSLIDTLYSNGVMTVAAEPYLENAYSYLAGRKIYVPDRIKPEFGDDWNAFRKRAFAAGIYLTSDSSDPAPDMVNAELAESLPGMFDANELDERTMLEQIINLAEESKDQKMSLPEYTAMLEKEGWADKDQVLDEFERKVQQSLENFADKAKLEIKLRDRTGIKLDQQRARFNERIDNRRAQEIIRKANERERRLNLAQRQREYREIRDLQQRTLKQLQWLNKNRYRAPEELKADWDQVLSDIDIYAVGAANELNWSNKYQATWRDLADMYKDARENDPNFLPSKELERIVVRLDNDKIADMDISALQDLYKAAVGLRTEFYNRNNVIADEQHRMFADVYASSKQEIANAQGGADIKIDEDGRVTGTPFDQSGLGKFMAEEQLTPINYLERMAGWNPDSQFYSMAKQLERGENDMRDYVVRAKRLLDDFNSEYKDWIKTADGQGKNGVWYEIEVPELLQLGYGDKTVFGDTVKVYMTPMQKVHMYLESQNYDNLRHMAGGRTFVNKDLYSKGKYQEAFAQGTTVRLAPETVKKIVSDLTPEEQALADVLSKEYYNSFAADRINKVANVLYGYPKAMTGNYAPIYTNKNYVRSEIGVYDATPEGVGNLKARQHSANPSYNISAIDAFERHVDQTARFVGMAIPARNWQTLLNWREKNTSMADVITHKWGADAKKYIEDLLVSLDVGTGGTADSELSKGLNWLLSRYVSGVFGFNPGIMFKQAASYPQFAAALGWDTAPNPVQIAQTNEDLINTYTSMLAYRKLGYATPETAQLTKNQDVIQRNKALRFTFGGGNIIAMDGVTVKAAWPWAENYVRKNFPDLEAGTQEEIDNGTSPFYKKVAEVYENAVGLTQPMYDEMHRPWIMKNSKGIVRAFTMFKTVPLQQMNSLRRAYGELRYYTDQQKNAENEAQREFADGKRKTAARKAAAATSATFASILMLEAIEFLNQLWKNKGKKYKDDEGNLTLQSIAEQVLKKSTSDAAGMVVGGGELADLLENLLLGEKWYGIDIPGGEQLNTVIDSMSSAASKISKIVGEAANIVEEGGDLGEYLKTHSAEIAGLAKELGEKAAVYLKGFPAENIEKYIMGTLQHIDPAAYTKVEDLFKAPTKSSLKQVVDEPEETVAQKVTDLLKRRGIELDDTTAQALAQLYKTGESAAVPTATPSSITVNGEERTLSAYQQQIYDKRWSSIVNESIADIVNSDEYKAADETTRSDMLEKLYSYAAETAKETLYADYERKKEATKADEIMATGISAAEWAVWAGLTQGLNKDSEKYAALAEADFSDETKIAIAGTIMGTEMETESGKPSQYAKMLDVIDSGLSMNDYLKLKEADAVDKYLKNASLDLPAEMIADLAVSVNDVDEDASETERWRAVIEVSDDPNVQLQALGSVMSEAKYRQARIAATYDIVPNVFVTIYERLPNYDADGNGSYKQAEIQAALDGIETSDALQLPGGSGGSGSLTTAQKAVLWQLLNTSTKSAKNNPYSYSIGQEVLDAVANAKAGADIDDKKLELPTAGSTTPTSAASAVTSSGPIRLVLPS